jgi:ATP-dependent Clp protease ATP-binding subunit ClpC
MSELTLHVSARVAWVAANGDACRAGGKEIEPPHLLLAILRLVDGMRGEEVARLKLDGDDLATLSFSVSAARSALGLDENAVTSVRRRLQRQVHGEDPSTRSVKGLHRSPATRALFNGAAERAIEAGDNSLTVVHLIEMLDAYGLVKAAVEGSALPQVTPQDVEDPGSSRLRAKASGEGDPPSLGRDLTALAAAGRLRPIVGRDGEIKQLARRLQRATKRNALLIGEAGVGKTAIVEGLAQYCAGGQAPESLSGLRIIEISVGDLIAGTKYRGDLEERVQALVAQLQDDPNLVGFIDEVHLAVARQGDESATIANLLKPVLDGDHVRCIAATTTEEFERHVKQDPAFARRFGRPIIVGEPTTDVALTIVGEWKQRIEEVHPGLTIADDAVSAAVELSAAHIPDRRLPDKAIDLLDDAATFAMLPTIHQSGPGPSKTGLTLTREHVEAVLQEQYGVDVALVGIDAGRLRTVLVRELIGQEAAVAQLVATLRSVRHTGESQQPLAILLFTGPTGVGKTYAAELIAGALFGAKAPLCRLNMNEYAERHEISRLTGAPPGFIGHEQPGALFAFVEGHREGVILLDEIEKAHYEVRQYFLQVFDAGEAMDSRGRTVSFAPYVFVMTSNALTEAPHPLGFAPAGEPGSADEQGEALRQELARLLSPEFVARTDAVVAFESLGPEALRSLVQRYVDEYVDELEQQEGVELSVSDDALHALCALAQSQTEGARGVRRVIEREVAAAVRESLARNAAPSGACQCTLDVRAGRFTVLSGSV